ncbi:MAG: hypothetical protein B6241_11720 [Spirochaetaceae bacterium 4572_59]|nr:MAG: hypothetical protein B6241_11720 [Spirochaetaceae bacterium 4572_59]
MFPYFALVYIVEGRGTWRSGERRGRQESREVVPGDCFLIIPEVWHSYFPDEKQGWTQYWVLFDGYYAQSLLKQGIFSQREAFFHPGLDYSIIDHFKTMKLMVENNQIPPLPADGTPFN